MRPPRAVGRVGEGALAPSAASATSRCVPPRACAFLQVPAPGRIGNSPGGSARRYVYAQKNIPSDASSSSLTPLPTPHATGMQARDAAANAGRENETQLEKRKAAEAAEVVMKSTASCNDRYEVDISGCSLLKTLPRLLRSRALTPPRWMRPRAPRLHLGPLSVFQVCLERENARARMCVCLCGGSGVIGVATEVSFASFGRWGVSWCVQLPCVCF